MASRLPLSVTVVLLLAFGAGGLSAQNLLTNPDFDTGLSGWQVGSGTSWNGTQDADGSPVSGSAQGGGTFATADGDAVVVTQCVSLPHGGDPYVLAGKIFIPAGQAASGGAFLSVGYYPTSDCSGVPIPGPGGLTPLVTAIDRWTATAVPVTTFGGSAIVAAVVQSSSAGTLQARFDDLSFAPPSATSCTADANTLCLNALRFAVTATYDAGNGNAGQAHAVRLTGDSGYFWFFDAANVEAIVKVIDGCGLGGHFWFFAGGLTNVKVVIIVTDVQTGAVKTYTNPANRPFPPIQDTSAFACP